MAGYKKPSWMVSGFSLSLKVNTNAGGYNPGGFQPRYMNKPTGQYNPGGGFETRDLPQPSGKYNPGAGQYGRFELRDVHKATGKSAHAGWFEEGVKDDRDPWGNYSFSMLLDGVAVGSFLECSGMKSTAEIHEIEEGGLNNGTHKRVGRSKWDNLILKHGECARTELLEWRDRYIQDGFSEQKSTKLTLVLRDNDGMELRRYEVLSPWPVSWEGPSLNSGGSELAITSIEIAHEGIVIDGGGTPDPPVVTTPPVPDKLEMEPVQFELDSAALTDDGQKTVDDMSEQLEKHPEVEELWVEGHTCNMGSHSHNQQLSAERAEAVASRLRSQHPDKTIHSSGFSYDHPVASNANNAGRVRNRRTEVWTVARGGSRAGELQ